MWFQRAPQQPALRAHSQRQKPTCYPGQVVTKFHLLCNILFALLNSDMFRFLFQIKTTDSPCTYAIVTKLFATILSFLNGNIIQFFFKLQCLQKCQNSRIHLKIHEVSHPGGLKSPKMNQTFSVTALPPAYVSCLSAIFSNI